MVSVVDITVDTPPGPRPSFGLFRGLDDRIPNLALECPTCQVAWNGSAQSTCWLCGQMGETYVPVEVITSSGIQVPASSHVPGVSGVDLGHGAADAAASRS